MRLLAQVVGNSLHERSGESFSLTGVVDGVVGAHVDAVEAVDAARAVDEVVGEVYAGAFANVDAAAALDAFVGVDFDVEHGEAADEAEGGADGAHRVAGESSASGCEGRCGGKDHDGEDGAGDWEEGRGGAAAGEERGEEEGAESGKFAVWIEDGDGYCVLEHQADEHCYQYDVAQIVARRGVAVGAAAFEGGDVLEGAEGTHRGAVDASEHERHHQPAHESCY